MCCKEAIYCFGVMAPSLLVILAARRGLGVEVFIFIDTANLRCGDASVAAELNVRRDIADSDADTAVAAVVRA